MSDCRGTRPRRLLQQRHQRLLVGPGLLEQPGEVLLREAGLLLLEPQIPDAPLQRIESSLQAGALLVQFPQASLRLGQGIPARTQSRLPRLPALQDRAQLGLQRRLVDSRQIALGLLE